MQNMVLHKLPVEYKNMLNNINNNVIKNLYSLFTFKYYQFTGQDNYEKKQDNDNNSSNYFISYMNNYLKKFKFITYHFPNFQINDKSLNSNFNAKINCILCFESECLIIEQIDKDLIDNLIQNLQNQTQTQTQNILNVSNSSNFSKKHSDNEKVEIQNFCAHFNNDIKSNEFVKYTIDSIAGYIIRRHFYPSNYFTDRSFFNFESYNKNTKEIEFKMNNFIILRTIFQKSKFGIYYFVIHLETFYIFLMKKFYNPNEITNEMQHEIDFCKSYSHYCLTKFYGFLKDNSKITGLIYEYMCNGDIETYLKNNKNKVDVIYLLISIYRIFIGIKYLHSNKLIHRDLKPSNILIDHDRLPYISDFETIRKSYLLPEEQITDDIGSPLYSSPEQDLSQNVSYATDIYSFGLIVYFIFEGKHMWNLFANKRDKIKTMTKGSFNIRYLYEKCVQYEPDERIRNEEIFNLISTDLYLFVCSIKFYDQYLQLNDSDALLFLGNLYEDGIGVKRNYLIAKQYYEQASKLNNSDALLNLGNIYKEGLGVEQNYSKALQYYEQSSKFNNSNAFLNLGHLYREGLGVNQNYMKAKQYFEQSSKFNNSNAFLNLGNFYAEGLGVEQDYMKAKQYFEQSSKLNNSDGIINLGHLYEEGLGVEQDYMKAEQYYVQASRFNNSNAFRCLGHLYEKGLGVKQDYTKAIKCYMQSSILNNSDALVNLGHLYADGLGVKQDYAIAKEYYEQASELNNSDALVNLGKLYEEGLGVKKDYLKAKQYYKQASELNNSDALLNLGNLYAKGLGVEQDYLRAKQLYEKSSKFNNSFAFLILGDIYAEGLGVKQDYLKAKQYYEQSSKLKNSDAFIYLGHLYKNGLGVDQDYMKAKQYYEQASLFNNSDAFLYLGYLYGKGLGVEQDYLKAKQYYEQSSKFNNTYALFFLGILHLNCGFFGNNLPKIMHYFLKSTQIQNGEKTSYDCISKSFILRYECNNYRYISFNILGLIYTTILDDIEKGEDNLKESAFAEYPHGQNNFGIFSQFYLNKIDNAEYMYGRSAKHNFSLAEFNLGHLLEKDDKINDSIQYYIQASEHENEPLEYRNLVFYDIRLEISKKYILCLTNLKLVEYFLSKNEYSESRKYFERSINCIQDFDEIITYPFDIVINLINISREKYPNCFFSFLKYYILNYPLFNLCNQPNLNLYTYPNIFNKKYIFYEQINEQSETDDTEKQEINEESKFKDKKDINDAKANVSKEKLTLFNLLTKEKDNKIKKRRNIYSKKRLNQISYH